jgi:DNA-binding MarR family transcriptional regulator
MTLDGQPRNTSAPTMPGPTAKPRTRTTSSETAGTDRTAGTSRATRRNGTAPAALTHGTPVETAALEYAGRHGWHVIPVIGKRPHPRLAPHGLKSASQDPDLVRAWFRTDPDAGVAVVCRPSGLIAVDVDDRRGGVDHLHDLEQALGRLPDTPRALTGDGFHVYAQNPNARTINQIAAGVDLRDRAYVVAPPSRHPSGQVYEWETAPDEITVAALPDAWLERIAHKTTDRSYRQPGPIPAGRRNNTLIKIAGAMRRTGLGAKEIEAALVITNRDRCQPPLERSEVRKIARWIGRRDLPPPWAMDAVGYACHEDKDLTPSERFVLAVLAHRANDQGEVIGGEWISNETGLSRNTISRAVRSLKKAETLTVKNRPNRANLYTLATPTYQDSSSSCTTMVQPNGWQAAA